jgi:hypothetical protein
MRNGVRNIGDEFYHQPMNSSEFFFCGKNSLNICKAIYVVLEYGAKRKSQNRIFPQKNNSDEFSTYRLMIKLVTNVPDTIPDLHKKNSKKNS